MLYYLLITILLIGIIRLYFMLSLRYNIFDVPNQRSSHTHVTIRGAGIIFPLAILLCYIFFNKIPIPLIAALLVIGTVSFVDDLFSLNATVRLFVHLISVSLLLYALGIFNNWQLWMVALAYPVIIVAINGFNFMDGINGITGLYSTVALLSMICINIFIVNYVSLPSLICPLIACVIFLYYNLRKIAKCFAGDVGSVSLAFWLIALVLALINATHEFKYLLLFSVYGIDVVFTIIKRISFKQNIFQAHRLHLYQLLVHHGNYTHRQVAIAYALVQALVNIFVINMPLNSGVCAFVTLSTLVTVYLIIRIKLNLNLA